MKEMISKIRIKGKFRNMTFITAHAPTEYKTEIQKEEFYEKLENVLNQCQEYDMVTILEDFNAKIEREKEMKGIIGQFSLHETSNENGNMLVHFAALYII